MLARPYLICYILFSQSIWISQLGLGVFLKLSFIEKNSGLFYSYLRKFFLFKKDTFYDTGLNKLCTQRWACMQCAHKRIITCTKLCAHKSIKTPLGSIPMLFKIVCYFCVWKQLIFGTIRSDIHNLFTWKAVVKYSYI